VDRRRLQATKLRGAQKTLGAQGIAVEILLAQPKDWNGKPGFLAPDPEGLKEPKNALR
jgi:hypothetical protein